MTVFIKNYVLLFQAKKTELHVGRNREYFSNDKRAHKQRMGSCENTREFNQSPNLIKAENIDLYIISLRTIYILLFWFAHAKQQHR